MTRCDIIPLASKACTGKCKGGACSTLPRVWVLAACGGMIAILERDADGAWAPVTGGESAVFNSLDHFQQTISAGPFNQLVIVGSRSDVAWVHASLPIAATPHIAAEVEYPLLPAWFKQMPPMPHLAQALENIFNV